MDMVWVDTVIINRGAVGGPSQRNAMGGEWKSTDKRNRERRRANRT